MAVSCWSARARVLVLTLALVACKSEGDSAAPVASDEQAAPLRVELLAIDTKIAPRGERPFIAGEQLVLTLRVAGGTAPYELQLLTSKGNPRLASGAVDIEAQLASVETAVEVATHSEVESGNYGLAVRVNDAQGRGSLVRSEPFEVVGMDAPLAEGGDNPLALRVVDVAGRARASFYQGEEIHLRALLPTLTPVAVGIVADDEREFMPVRSYQPADLRVDIPLMVPRLARVGAYRVDAATDTAQASVPLRVVGRSFPAQTQLALSELVVRGGADLRAPRAGLLKRGETLQVEALAAGIRSEATAELRLRDRASKIVARVELPRIVPADLHPEARVLVSGTWTPAEDLLPGRYTLELELSEGDRVAALYREIQLGDKAVKGFSREPKLFHAEPEIDQ